MTYTQPSLEIADIFNQFGSQLSNLSRQAYKVVNSITACRTNLLGGHELQCDSCDYRQQAYNSCRNRHCPKCQFSARQQWIEARTNDLLPCKYYHAVFTVPSELRSLMLQNKKVLYDVLFKASAETLKEVARTQLKVEIGFFGVLHTWSQTLIDHPHVHFVVPGGGVKDDQWVPLHEDYLLPVQVLSMVFRAKLLEKIERLYYEGRLTLLGQLEHLTNPGLFRDLMIKCTEKSFNVDIRKPFSGPTAVIRYLGSYTHRIAISNHRLVKIENDKVYFKCRDPEDPSKRKVISLKVREFMRRFLLHVLPKGFVRIRHYGLLSTKRLRAVKKLCKVANLAKELKETCKEIFARVTGKDPDKCPKCEHGKLEMKKTIRMLLNSA